MHPTAAACIEETETAERVSNTLAREEPGHRDDLEEIIEEIQFNPKKPPENEAGDWEEESPQYDWDDEEYDESHTEGEYRANTIRVSHTEEKCGKVTLQKQEDGSYSCIRIAAGC
jgi:hypothetical protein